MNLRISYCFVTRFILKGLILLLPAMAFPQNSKNTSYYFDFENPVLESWITVGDEIELNDHVKYKGKQSLEIKNASSAEYNLKVKPSSTYSVSAWVKTSSGSDLIQLNISGLGENNIAEASARTDWTELKKVFNVGEGQIHALLEIVNADNPGKNSAWVDEIRIERIADYKSVKVAGIKSLPVRHVKIDQGIQQQPNEKLDWFLDAKFSMFIHWGLYAGPARGEWLMYNEAMFLKNACPLEVHGGTTLLWKIRQKSKRSNK